MRPVLNLEETRAASLSLSLSEEEEEEDVSLRKNWSSRHQGHLFSPCPQHLLPLIPPKTFLQFSVLSLPHSSCFHYFFFPISVTIIACFCSIGTSADDLYPLFEKYGKVVDVFIPRDRRFYSVCVCLCVYV